MLRFLLWWPGACGTEEMLSNFNNIPYQAHRFSLQEEIAYENSIRYMIILSLPLSLGPLTGHLGFPPFHAPFKINFDGVLFKDIYVVGLGVVVRKNQGEVIGAMSEKISLPYSMVDMEALACRKAVIFA